MVKPREEPIFKYPFQNEPLFWWSQIRDLTVLLFDAEYSATNLENPEKGCQKFDF